MEYSAKQRLASLYNRNRTDNRYIVNKREKGQKRFFTCSCCGRKMDFGNSVDYVGAVEQWEGFGSKCYVCGRGLGTKESFPCHVKE